MVFEDIWAASAFKGATGPCAFVTDIGFHVENHRVWLRSIRNNQSKFKSFRGLALTGWQRYIVLLIFTVRNSSCGKVCFHKRLSPCPQGGGGVHGKGGVCAGGMHSMGCAWQGGMHGMRGACMA